MQSDKTAFHTQIDGYDFQCHVQGHSLLIEVSKESEDCIYVGDYSNDTLPQHIKVLFENPQQLFEYFVDQASSRIQISSPNALKISYTISNRLRLVQLPLDAKQLTKEELLEKRLKQKHEQILSLKKNSASIKEINELSQKLNEKSRRLIELEGKIGRIEQRNQQLQKNLQRQNKLSAEYLQEIQYLKSDKKMDQQSIRKELQVLKDEKAKLNQKLEQQEETIGYLNRELIQRQSLLSYFTSGIDAPPTASKPSPPASAVKIENKAMGVLLQFRPMTSHSNFKCYNFKDNVLTKNGEAPNGTGRLILCQDPVPKSGRFYYNIRSKTAKNLPNYRLGFIAKSSIVNDTYVNGGDPDSVMYYCYSTDKELIYEGGVKFQGFKVDKGQTMGLAIDRQKKIVEWYRDGVSMVVSKFTESLRKAENIYLFVQLWANGDELEFN